MTDTEKVFPFIRCLTTEYEDRIREIPFLNIDSMVVPSPYIRDNTLDVDYEHSYVWEEEGEILGYFLVYSNPGKTVFHIYRQVSSPFGRGKGIGSACIEKLVEDVSPDAHIYLYVWDKLSRSIDFFRSKGFTIKDLIVYRKMKFHLMSATAGMVRDQINNAKNKDFTAAEELSRIRHDAKKELKILLDMASMLSVDNSAKVIEDINRETTALLNMLNLYEDRIKAYHPVNIKELITERVIPFIEASSVPCDIRFVICPKIPHVVGNYVNFSRALINIVSNSLDAIRDSRRHGVIEITLAEKDEKVILSIRDNGTGIDEERLKPGSDGVPLFVGQTTKQTMTGEGVGTRQIYSTFGTDAISIESRMGEYTKVTLRLNKSTQKDSAHLSKIKSCYVAYIKSSERIAISESSARIDAEAIIWQLRRLEIFSYGLVCQFSAYNNIRDIYRNILMYRYGGKDFQFLKTEIRKCRIDHDEFRAWLLGTTRRIQRNETYVTENLDFEEYKGCLFKSYGQSVDSTIIFTLDPENGRFLASDRRLAEHADFVPFLSGKRDLLLRGEFIGDVRNIASPIYLGVWSVTDLDDMHDKLKLIRKGAQQLLKMDLKRDKLLSLYATTYNNSAYDIDTFATTTLGEMAAMADKELDRFITSSEDELQGLVFAE